MKILNRIDHPGDIIPAKTSIEIKTKNLIRNNQLFFIIGEFDDNGVAYGNVSEQYGLIEQVQINISRKPGNWILISEITFL